MFDRRLLICFMVIFIALSTSFQVLAESTNENQVSLWKILEWNDNITVAWDWGVKSFNASKGSYINYTLAQYDPFNFTHPSAGEIVIGNLTTQTTNNKTGEVLVLSIWGWFPGLVTSSKNWDLQKEVAQEAASGEYTNGTLIINEINYNYSGNIRQAISFSYTQDPSTGNQNTTLIYDKETGVLLEGMTELLFFEYYVLHLKLVESDLISSGNLTPWGAVSPVVAIAGIIIGRKIKKHRKAL